MRTVKKALLVFLAFSLLIGVGGSVSFASDIDDSQSSINDNTSAPTTITIEVPFVPWERPSDEILALGRDTHNEPLLLIEIPLIGDDEDIPFKPGERTVVTDGLLIYVIDDEFSITRGIANPSREFKIWDTNLPLLWHGTIRIWGYGVYDGTYISLSEYDSYVVEKPNSSNLAVTSTSITGNSSPLVTIKSVFSVKLDSGATLSSNRTLSINGSGQY